MSRGEVVSEFAHSPLRPTRDAASRNIVVNSVQLAERERETRLLRQQLARVKDEYADLAKEHRTTTGTISRLKARLSSGGLAVGFQNLDTKYQALLKRMSAREDANRRLESENRDLQLRVNDVTEAVNFRADELQFDVDSLIDVAKGGKLLRQRDEAIATLNEEYENAEKEASALKMDLLRYQEDQISTSQQLERQHSTIALLKKELETAGSRVDENWQLLEQANNEKSELTARFQSAAGSLSELKETRLYNDVLIKQLDQAREANGLLEEQLSELDGSKRDEMIEAIAQMRAQISTLTATNETLQKKSSQIDDITHEKTAYSNKLREQTAKLSTAEQHIRELQIEVVESKREKENNNSEQLLILTDSVKYLTIENKRVEIAMENEQNTRKDYEKRLKEAKDEISRMKLLRDMKRKASSQAAPSQRRSRSPVMAPSIVESAFAMATTPPSTGSLPGAPVPPHTSQSFAVSDATSAVSISPSRFTPSPSKSPRSSLHDLAYGGTPPSLLS